MQLLLLSFMSWATYFSLKPCHLTSSVCHCIVIPQISLLLISSHYPSPTEIYLLPHLVRECCSIRTCYLNGQIRTCYLNGKLPIGLLILHFVANLLISFSPPASWGTYWDPISLFFWVLFFFFGRYKQFSAASFISPQGEY